MHLKKDYITMEIGDKQVMTAVGASAKDFHGIAKSNGTAAFIVDQLKTETTEEKIVDALLDTYDVEKNVAEKDVHNIIEKLQSIGAIE